MCASHCSKANDIGLTAPSVNTPFEKMSYQLKQIRLDKLNIPVETLRKSSFPASDKKLEDSIENYGVIVPLIVVELGKGEYSVWDGTRRVTALRNMGKPGSFTAPALVTKGTDKDSVFFQMNINQNRERLSSFAEAEALRQLVASHKMTHGEAAKKLLKSRTWAVKVLKVFDLSKNILSDFNKGKIILSQAIVLSKYADRPKVLKLLYKEALKGISADNLKALAFKSENLSGKDLERYKPKLYKAGQKSWVRVKPLQRGVNFNIHLEQGDEPEELIQRLEKIITQLKIN